MNGPLCTVLTVLVVRDTVGFVAVLQTTPLARIVDPPLLITTPPLVTELPVTPVIVAVVTSAKVVNVRWLPYAVPEELVAYART